MTVILLLPFAVELQMEVPDGQPDVLMPRAAWGAIHMRFDGTAPRASTILRHDRYGPSGLVRHSHGRRIPIWTIDGVSPTAEEWRGFE